MRKTLRSILAAAFIATALVPGVCASAYAQEAPRPPASLEALAQERYQQGRERFFAEDFEGARAAFQSSLDAVDSPNARMYLGRALQRLGRLAEAWSMLDRAARDADSRAASEPRYTPTRDAARAEADALTPSLAWLTLDIPDAPDDLRVTVNDLSLARGAIGVPLPMMPGAVTVTARAAGRRDASRTLTLVAGAREPLRFTLDALPTEPPVITPPRQPPRIEAPPDHALRNAGIATGAVGVAALVVGGVFGALAQAQYDALDAGPRPGNSDAVALGTQQRDLANGFFIGGGVAVAAGVGMILGAAFSRASRPAPVTLLLGPSVGVAGSF